jgi:hypothetical protein
MEFRATQPGKLCLQNRDGFGRGFLEHRAHRKGFRCCRHQGATGSLVAPKRSTTPRSEAATLREGFVEENVGGFGHELSSDTTFARLQQTSKCFQHSRLRGIFHTGSRTRYDLLEAVVLRYIHMTRRRVVVHEVGKEKVSREY